MKISKLCVHNTGGLGTNLVAKTSTLTLEQINAAHKARKFNLSELGYYVGYNFLIFPDGRTIQTRYIGEETCAAIGSNFDSIHICLLGNFTVGAESPTFEQKFQLRNMVKGFLNGTWDWRVKRGTILDLSYDRIYPHRLLQPTTSCYGNSLPDNWVKEIIGLPEDPKKLLVALYEKLLELLKLKKQLYGRGTVPCSECDVIG